MVDSEPEKRIPEVSQTEGNIAIVESILLSDIYLSSGGTKMQFFWFLNCGVRGKLRSSLRMKLEESLAKSGSWGDPHGWNARSSKQYPGMIQEGVGEVTSA